MQNSYFKGDIVVFAKSHIVSCYRTSPSDSNKKTSILSCENRGFYAK